MIERYTLPEMGKIWSLENEWRTILNVELAACDAMAELGEIPADAAKNIRAKANFTVERIKEIEGIRRRRFKVHSQRFNVFRCQGYGVLSDDETICRNYFGRFKKVQ